jgi:hypothetical protein
MDFFVFTQRFQHNFVENQKFLSIFTLERSVFLQKIFAPVDAIKHNEGPKIEKIALVPPYVFAQNFEKT